MHRDVLADFKVVSSFLIRRLTVAAPGSRIDCGSSLVDRAGVNSFSGAGFWLRRHFVITIIGELYLATTDQTTKARRHKGRAKRFGTTLRLCDLCGLWASRARQPIDRIAAWQGSMALAPGALPVGRAVRDASSSSGRVLVRAPAWGRVPAWAWRPKGPGGRSGLSTRWTCCYCTIDRGHQGEEGQGAEGKARSTRLKIPLMPTPKRFTIL